MIKKRLIPVLLLKDGWLVQSKQFNKFRNLGNPVVAVKRLSEWAADELIYLDITKEGSYDLRRDDLKHPNRSDFLEIIEDISEFSFMPITVGGRIRTLNDIEERLRRGADKVAINTIAIEDPSFVTKAAEEFGAQCIVVSIDAKKVDGRYKVFSHGGQTDTGKEASAWAKEVETLGAGEILINSIDRDGTRLGYDVPLIESVCSVTKIPVIALGGADDWDDFEDLLEETSVDAVAAANIFHYTDQSVYLAKKQLFDSGFNVREPFIINIDRI